MAENEAASAPAAEQRPDQNESTNEVSINQEDVEIAGKEATTEVNAPDGETTTEVAVTPEASASASKKEKRKSISGVPEHKSKKLNKKKSTTSLQLKAEPGDYYWARLKGYPPWPAIIADEEMLPESILASRPVSTRRADGSLREDFQDDGKNAKDRTYPVMFLGTNEFSWMLNTSLSPLNPDECRNKPGKIAKGLASAYDIAVEQPDLAYFKRILQQFQEETSKWEEEQRQKESEKAEKAAAKQEKDEKKKARKSKGGDDDEDVDMEDAEPAKPTKKRKKDAAGDADDEKTKKAPKITKLNAPKQNGDTAKKETKPKKKVAAPKPNAKEDKPEMTEAERLQQREKHVLYLRHRLQKSFLGGDAPQGDDMDNINEFFQQLESLDELEPSIIRTTKIHKVLKAIIKLNSVARDDELHFKKRSQTLLEAWNKRMEANGDVVSKPAEGKSPTTNGDVKTKDEEDKTQEEGVKQADEIDKKVENVGTTEVKKEEPETTEAKDDKPEASAEVDGDTSMQEDDKTEAKTVEAES